MSHESIASGGSCDSRTDKAANSMPMRGPSTAQSKVAPFESVSLSNNVFGSEVNANCAEFRCPAVTGTGFGALDLEHSCEK